MEELADSKFRDNIDAIEQTLPFLGDGAAVAANQLGFDFSAFLTTANYASDDGDVWRLNPFIIERSNRMITANESCLSFPGITLSVARSEHVVIEYLTLNGQVKTEGVSGFRARMFQHEIDHLEGRLFVDHLSAGEKNKIAMKILKKVNGNVR